MKKINLIIITLLVAFGGNLLQVQAADTLYDNRFKRWQEKAEKGDAFSQYSLGNAYLRGNEVKIDTSKAIKWFKAAAKQGHAKSEYKLGYLYYTGKGVRRSYDKAHDWFGRAARRNYAPAQFYMGKIYASGYGVDQDKGTAVKWFSKADLNGYSPARNEIKKLSGSGASKPARVAKPKPAPVRKKKVAKKASKRSTKFNALNVLEAHQWSIDGKPSEVLPSDLSKCVVSGGMLNCSTGELVRSNPFAEIRYRVEGTMSRFNKKGEFFVSTRENIIFVLPSDPDDPEVDPEMFPESGWSQPKTMKCKFVSKVKISCSTDSFQKVVFNRDY